MAFTMPNLTRILCTAYAAAVAVLQLSATVDVPLCLRILREFMNELQAQYLSFIAHPSLLELCFRASFSSCEIVC